MARPSPSMKSRAAATASGWEAHRAPQHDGEAIRMVDVVGIENGDEVAGRPLDPGIDRAMRTTVLPRPEGDLRMALAQSIDASGRAIGGSVVDDDDLMCRHRLGEHALQRLLDIAFMVVERNDHGDPMQAAADIRRSDDARPVDRWVSGTGGQVEIRNVA